MEVFDSINELIEAANSDLMESSTENEYWSDDGIRPATRPANQSPLSGKQKTNPNFYQHEKLIRELWRKNERVESDLYKEKFMRERGEV